MAHICIANTRNGLQCKKNKVNAHFCKIHSTNEICATCGSDEISTTDSILKSYGSSLCNACRKVLSDEVNARARASLIEIEKKAEIQRLEYEEIMRTCEIQRKLMDNESQIQTVRFMELMNELYNM